MAAAGALLLSACGAAVGVGGDRATYLATTRIRTDSEAAVRQAVEEVFRADGFAVDSRTGRSISFSKVGGRSAEIAWTTVGNPNPVMIRPTVSWRPDGPGAVWVGVRVEITQQSTAFGETVRRPIMTGRSAYSGLLRQVRVRVERGG